jgi:hypothetical protein
MLRDTKKREKRGWKNEELLSSVRLNPLDKDNDFASISEAICVHNDNVLLVLVATGGAEEGLLIIELEPGGVRRGECKGTNHQVKSAKGSVGMNVTREFGTSHQEIESLTLRKCTSTFLREAKALRRVCTLVPQFLLD